MSTNDVNPNVAKTMADLVTPRQLVAIRAIANSQGRNAENICRERMKCSSVELSRRAASAFIDLLKQPEEVGAEIEQVQVLISQALSRMADQSMASVIRRLVFQPQTDWSKGVDAMKLYCPDVKLESERATGEVTL